MGKRVIGENDRIYRLQLELTTAHGIPTGIGLLKARLFASMFVHNAYILGCAITVDQAMDALQLCTGMAMEPFFSQPDFSPSISRAKADSFAGQFVLKASRLIRQELEAPSTARMRSKTYHQLMDTYHDCLKESCPRGTYTQVVRRKLDIYADQVVSAGIYETCSQIQIFQQ
jgi:hypothetical protein